MKTIFEMMTTFSIEYKQNENFVYRHTTKLSE